MKDPNYYVTPNEMQAARGISRVNIWRWTQEDGFPENHGTPKRRKFIRAEVIAWIESKGWEVKL